MAVQVYKIVTKSVFSVLEGHFEVNVPVMFWRQILEYPMKVSHSLSLGIYLKKVLGSINLNQMYFCFFVNCWRA